MSIIEHIFLFVLLFLLFYYWGTLCYNTKKLLDFWLLALIPILYYSFVVGSRYGWGVDYLGYKYRLENAFTYDEEQLGFRYLNQTISTAGLDYVGGFMVYSLIFVVCGFILMRSYGKVSRYMYAFFVPATLLFTSGIIRQGLAVSFLFLAIYFLNKRRWAGVILSVLIGALIHISILISAVLIGFFYIISKKPFSWKITIPLYLFFAFVFDVSKIGVIAEYMQYITLDGKFQSYVENSDQWFGSDAVNDIYEQGTLTLVLSSLFHAGMIYIGYWALKLKPSVKISYLYNAMVFGLILLRAVFLFEILKRFAQPLIMMHFIVLGYSVYVFTTVLNNKRLQSAFPAISIKPVLIYYKVLLVGIMLYLLLFWGRFVFQNPQAAFFWNI